MAVGDQLAAIGQVEADGVAFGEEAVAVLKHRDSAVGVDVAQELGRPRLALHDVVAAPFERQLEMRGGQPDLVAIARPGIFVEDQAAHASPVSTILPIWSPAFIRRMHGLAAAIIAAQLQQLSEMNRVVRFSQFLPSAHLATICRGCASLLQRKSAFGGAVRWKLTCLSACRRPDDCCRSAGRRRKVGGNGRRSSRHVHRCADSALAWRRAAGSKFRAGLTIAPTQRSQAISGESRTQIGEGLALSFTGKRPLTFSLAGRSIIILLPGRSKSKANKARHVLYRWSRDRRGRSRLVGGAYSSFEGRGRRQYR